MDDFIKGRFAHFEDVKRQFVAEMQDHDAGRIVFDLPNMKIRTLIGYKHEYEDPMHRSPLRLILGSYYNGCALSLPTKQECIGAVQEEVRYLLEQGTVQYCRHMLGMTQQEVAKAAGFKSYQQIQKLEEAGEKIGDITLRNAIKVSNALKIPTQCLLSPYQWTIEGKTVEEWIDATKV